MRAVTRSAAVKAALLYRKVVPGGSGASQPETPLARWWRLIAASLAGSPNRMISGQTSEARFCRSMRPRSRPCPIRALLNDLRMLPISNRESGPNPLPYHSAATAPSWMMMQP